MIKQFIGILLLCILFIMIGRALGKLFPENDYDWEYIH